ncbi:MAG: transposase [Paludibacteraceae bacterium]|nr:transposase [Paludibacteraceae bacterium]
MNNYPTNLTDNQWQVIEKFLDVQERKRKYPLRNIVNAINYLLKTGCQWRMLPKDFPPYNLAYYYFSKWKNEGVFEDLFIKLHIWLRIILGREECGIRSGYDSISLLFSDV